jgi:hypothetical protein
MPGDETSAKKSKNTVDFHFRIERGLLKQFGEAAKRDRRSTGNWLTLAGELLMESQAALRQAQQPESATAPASSPPKRRPRRRGGPGRR